VHPRGQASALGAAHRAPPRVEDTRTAAARVFRRVDVGTHADAVGGLSGAALRRFMRF